MRYRFIKEEIAYTGEQLRSHFAYKNFGIIGDSIISFCGPCDVKLKEMVDIDDLKAGKSIYSELMLHFIIEHYDRDLEKAVLRQYLITDIVKDAINDVVGKLTIRRVNSDLYDDDNKLSVSVATVSPISTLIHFGVNVTSINTPVKTRGLRDYNIEPNEFANIIMDRYVKDYDKICAAQCKVRWVD
ncbi:hypothetical protein AMJ52_04330 [candidate division TA06 bacterium DG_78]|uniref:DUF366 domain-containing protein n=1 Tax=candidate division TA06 bacterium DG_78 TaxID=1703772 RepID=A0A0S7YFH3_UNCT6|nr:MAG: hypothetical protein AMJ52_04330 [candidate division TA06 bacterium DG_78]